MKKNGIIILLVLIIIFMVVIMTVNMFSDNLNVNNINPFLNTAIEKPVLNVVDNHTIDMDNDLYIKWDECSNAISYKYSVILLPGQPDYGNDKEREVPGVIVLDENTSGTNNLSIIISKDKLIKSKWIKVAVAACNNENFQWTQAYIYVDSNKTPDNNIIITINSSAVTPIIDGTIKEGEYGQKIHSVNYNDSNFYPVGDSNNINADFYMSWDKTNLYCAWYVKSNEHWYLNDFNNDGKIDNQDYSFLWKTSSLQFMLCTGAPDINNPKYQTEKWKGDYLEAGFALFDKDTGISQVWSLPNNCNSDLVQNINYKCTADEVMGATVYEVAIPWKSLNIDGVSIGTEFGFSYSIAVQENFDVDANIVEWQNAIIGTKNMDAGAIVHLS